MADGNLVKNLTVNGSEEFNPLDPVNGCKTCIAEAKSDGNKVIKKNNLYLVTRYVSWSGNGWMRNLAAFSFPAIIFATSIFLLFHPGILASSILPGKSSEES